MDIKRLTFDFEVKESREHKEGAAPFFEFKGYAAVFNNVDLVGDVIVPGAFKKSLEKKSPADIMLFYQHDIREMPIGVLKDIREDKRGLLVTPQLPLKNSKAKDVAALIEIGGLNKFSIGFHILDSEEKNGVNFIKEIDLVEVSVVNFPANPEAIVTEKYIPMSKHLKTKAVPQIVNFPLADQDREWDNDEADASLRRFLDIEEPNAAYRNAHMWLDAESPENFTSYKLLFVDIVDGEQQAIPRAIFAIRGAIDGARGGLDVPDSDLPALKRYVNHYYERMDLEKPFTTLSADSEEERALDDDEEEIKSLKNITVKNLSAMRHSDLIKAIRKNGNISKSVAEKIVKGYKHSQKHVSNDDTVLEKISKGAKELKLVLDKAQEMQK